MKIFITGASGLVGSNVARVASRRGHEVVAAAGSWSGEIPGARRIVRVNLALQSEVHRVVLDEFPDVIINAAAISESARVETQPQLARILNVDLPASLAQLAHHVGARLLHLSSEQVFDGARPPYRVGDPVAPVFDYGRHKVESEKLVVKFAPENAVTIRLPLLAGNSLGGRRSMNERLFLSWAEGKPAQLFDDEIRQPCSAGNVAEMLVELAERRDFAGKILHWAGADPLSRWEMGERVLAHFKLTPDGLIQRLHRADVPGGALRQHDLTLDCAPLDGILKTRRESFDELLEKLIVPQDCREWYHRPR